MNMVHCHAYNLKIWDNLKINRPELNKIHKIRDDALLFWAISSYISSFLLKKQKKKTYFFGDSKSIKILKDINAFYDEYIDVDDFLIDDYRYYWSYVKIKSIQLLDEPFIFTDNDLFLYKDISEYFYLGDVLYDSRERIFIFETYINAAIFLLKSSIGCNIKSPSWNLFLKEYVSNQKLDISSFKQDIAFNCSVLGFKDISLGKEYSLESTELYDSLKDNIHTNMRTNSIKHLPTFFEQYILKKFCDVKNIKAVPVTNLNSIDENSPYYFHLLNYKHFTDLKMLVRKAQRIVDPNISADYFQEKL